MRARAKTESAPVLHRYRGTASHRFSVDRVIGNDQILCGNIASTFYTYRPVCLVASASALPRRAGASSSEEDGKSMKEIGSKMVGFVLAQEEFTVPQVIDIGVSAEQAGFVSSQPAIIFNLGRQMRGTAAKPGQRWGLSFDAAADDFVPELLDLANALR